MTFSGNARHEAVKLAELCDALDAQQPHAYAPNNGLIERWRFRPNWVHLHLTGSAGVAADQPVAGRALSSECFWCVTSLFIHPGQSGEIELRTGATRSHSLPGRVASCRYVGHRSYEIEFRFVEAIDVGRRDPAARADRG